MTDRRSTRVVGFLLAPLALVGLVLLAVRPARAGEVPPSPAAAELERAFASEQAGDAPGALAAYGEAIAKDPASAQAHLGRGTLRQHLHDFDGSLVDLDRALALDPKNASAWYVRGNTKQMKGDRLGACADYAKAIELAPEDPYAYEGRGTVVLAGGDAAAALPDFTRAIELDPEFAFAYEGRSRARRDTDDLERALEDLDKAIGLQEPFGVWLCNRGMMRFDAGRYAEAVLDLRASFGKPHDDVYRAYARYYLWMARAQLGEREAASKELRGWLDGEPAIVRRSWGGDLARFVTGQGTEAELGARVETFPAAERDVRRAQAQFAVGFLRLLRDDAAGARAAFEKTVALGEKSLRERRSAMAFLRRMRGS